MTSDRGHFFGSTIKTAKIGAKRAVVEVVDLPIATITPDLSGLLSRELSQRGTFIQSLITETTSKREGIRCLTVEK
jgi:hypothetical protein